MIDDASPLLRADFQTGTWDRFAELMRRRLAAHREENDQRLDDVKTATLRGRIAELKELLALGDQAPAESVPGSASFDAFPRT